jgi:hypothetical protein
VRAAVVVAILSGGAVLASPAVPACACSCAISTEAEAVQHADVVFVGTVAEIDKPLAVPFVGSADPVTVTFAVTDVYKGGVPANAQLKTERSGVSCGYMFAAGARYLVYASIDETGTWRTSLCSGNRQLAAGEAVPPGGHAPGPWINRPSSRPWLLALGGVTVLLVIAVPLMARRRRRRPAS